MPLTIDLPPMRRMPVQEVRSGYEIEGMPGQSLVKRFAEVLDQWQSRPSLLADPHSQVVQSPVEQPVEEQSFSHIPFKKIGKLRVRYKAAVPMKPRSINFEEDASE